MERTYFEVQYPTPTEPNEIGTVVCIEAPLRTCRYVLGGQVPDGYDEEEVDQPSDQEQKRRRGEEAGARRGYLFTSTDENL